MRAHEAKRFHIAGEIVEVELLISHTELPPPAAQAVASDRQRAGGYRVEEVVRGGHVVGYEVAFAGGSRRDSKVTFDLTGRIASE